MNGNERAKETNQSKVVIYRRIKRGNGYNQKIEGIRLEASLILQDLQRMRFEN